MPKSTFYRISEEKRNRIVNAARHEFMNVPYNEVSINRIIKEAEIPRGSFYQYFDGKEDLFHFVLQEHKSNFLRILIEEIDKADGDLFKSVENQIDRIIEFVYHDNSGKVRMLFSEPWIFETIWRAIIKDQACKGDVSCGLVDRIDDSLLDVEDEEELVLLINILVVVVRDSVGNIFLHNEKLSAEEAKNRLCAKVKTLKKHYNRKSD
ncbi:MAG: TetR family transcriptional regulator [Eubacterium sp.]